MDHINLPRVGMPPSVFKSKKLPSLDGLRGLSIMAVLFAHGSKVPGYPVVLDPASWWGGGGVHCFFVISGYLITTLLLREFAENHDIALIHFYKRRALRLFPAYFGFTFVIFLLHITPFHLPGHGWLGLLTFTANIYPGNSTTSHFWSLAVEEQFYALWPPMLLMIILSSTHSLGFRHLFTLLTTAILACPLARLFIVNESRGWLGIYSFIMCADVIAWGCMLALIAHYFPNNLQAWIKKWNPYLLFISLLMIFGPTVFRRLVEISPIGPLSMVFPGIGFFLLVAWCVVFHDRWMCRWLNHGALPKIGVLSYSIYVWHMIFRTNPAVFGLKWAPWGNFAGFMVASLLTGWLSWRFLERPFLQLRQRLRIHQQ